MDPARDPPRHERRDELDDELDDEDPELTEKDLAGEKGRGDSFAGKVLSDLARRALMTGIGAVFMSEDSLRGALSDMKLPKEAMAYVMGQADRTKNELIRTIARETRSFLNTLEIEKLIARVLAGTTLEIHTKIRISPGPNGNIGFSVEGTETSVKRTRGPLYPDDAPAAAGPSTETPDDEKTPARRKPRARTRKSDEEEDEPSEQEG